MTDQASDDAKRDMIYLIPQLRGPIMPGETPMQALLREIKANPKSCAVIRGVQAVTDTDDAKDWAWRLAIDEAGIYPKAILGGEHAYEKRTEWQEGHNAAIMEVTKRAIEIIRQYPTEAQYEAAHPQEPD